MRVLAILVWAAVAVLVAYFLTRALNRPRARRTTPADDLDKLVKDPVCHTYVVRSRAIRRDGAEGARYFCSDECAARAGRG